MEYFFITRCYNINVEGMMTAVKEKERAAPDVIIMNSCLWDITRYMPLIENYALIVSSKFSL
jgi:hypothetical protein